LNSIAADLPGPMNFLSVGLKKRIGKNVPRNKKQTETMLRRKPAAFASRRIASVIRNCGNSYPGSRLIVDV
jgi:hypothetical protein